MSETTKAALHQALLSIPRLSSVDDDQGLTGRLRQALVDFGSATDDNVAAVDRVTIGALKTSAGRAGWGLRLATSGLPLVAIINSAEGSPIPEQVRAAYPTLTGHEWDAVLRVACLVFLSFERQRTG